MNSISCPTKFGCTFLSVVLLSIVFIAQQPSAGHAGRSGGHIIQLSSSAFPAGGNIPRQFTCQGEDVSPELTWKNAPKHTKVFALIVHDPDAPRAGGFTHWVAYNIPAKVNHLPQAIPSGEQLPGGGLQGKNDFEQLGYRGPCPPSGTHRYYFYLYALDLELNLRPGATKEDVERAMKGHLIEKAELMGKYRKLP